METLGKSQKELARELKVSAAYVSQLLRGKKRPPNFAKSRNQDRLQAWARSLAVAEGEVINVVRVSHARLVDRQEPRFPGMRKFLLERLDPSCQHLSKEIKGLEFHPAEGRAIHALIETFVVGQGDLYEQRAYARSRVKEFMVFAKEDRNFVEGQLIQFYLNRQFTWNWDAESNAVHLETENCELHECRKIIRELVSGGREGSSSLTIPVVGHVSAGEGFEYTDGGYYAGEGFDQVPVPPGVAGDLAARLYCVRVRGNSLKDFFGDGTLLFIKPESWEEIRDGDLVIFKDRDHGRAFVKKVEFAAGTLILKSMNPLYDNMVLNKTDLMLLERVKAVLF